MGYKIILQRSSDNQAIGHPAQASVATNLSLAGRVIKEDLSWYVPHYTPNISNQNLMLGHIVSNAATELSFIKRSSYMKDVTTKNNWTFEFGVEDGIEIPIYVIVGFMQRDQFNEHYHNNDSFYRQSVVIAQCSIGSEKFPDAGINCRYAIDKYSQAYGEVVSCFEHLAEDNLLQIYITQKDFKTSDNYPDGKPGCNIYVLDVRHHQDFSSARPIKIGFDFRPAVPAATSLFDCALLLTKKLVSVSSDGQKQVDLVYVNLFFFHDSIIFFHC